MYDFRTGRIFLEAIYTAVKDTAPRNWKDEDYPYLMSLKSCHICTERIAVADEHVAVRQDDPSRSYTVHEKCSQKMGCCDRRYLWGGWHRNDSCFLKPYNFEGEYICQLCLDERLLDNNEILDEDYFLCNSCDNFRHNDSADYFNGEQFCQRCIDDHVYTCDDCSEQYWEGSDHYCSESSYGGLIHDYGYKPRPYFYGRTSGERIFMGFELEVEVRSGNMRDQASEVVNALGDHAYLKHDGSLNHGFEIVTHPHSLNSYKKEFAFDSFKRFRSNGLRSWDTSTCGLHVHVSRNAFGVYDNRTDTISNNSRQFHELRFIKLIYDNQRQVCALAGRTSEDYANFHDKGRLRDKVINGYSAGGRHSAVNTENTNTLEVRIFRGSLNENRVLMALEFVHCAVEYTRNLKVNGKNKALSWLAFVGYVHANQEQYPHLHAVMASTFERGIPRDQDEE
jgi:hypothetical protein